MYFFDAHINKLGYFKYFFSTILVVFWLGQGFSQEKNTIVIDSLKMAYPSQTGTGKIQSLYELARQSHRFELDTSIYYDSLALVLAEEVRDTSWSVKLLADLSYYNLRKFDYVNAKILLERALDLSRKSGLKNELAIVYTDMGNYFFELNLYDSALFNYHNALSIEEDLVDRSMSISLNNIGLVYYRIRNFSTSINYYVKALNLILVEGDTSETFSSRVNIGLAYLAMDELDLAKKEFEKAIDIGEKYNSFLISHGYNGLGQVYIKLNDVDNAKKFLMLSIETAEKFGDRRLSAYSYSHLAELEMNNRSLSNAKIYIDSSQSIVRSIGDDLIARRNYQLYSQLYEVLGQYDSAYYYHKEYSKIESNIFNERLNNNLANLQLLRQAEETQQIIAQKEQDITQKTKLSRLLAVVLVLSVLLIIVVTRNYVNSSRVNKKLSAYNARIEKQNEDLGRKNKQLAEAQRTIEIQNERLRDVNSQLEEAVRIRTKQLERSNVRLGKAVKDLDDFIYKTSHDLRGPIATMQGIIKVGTMESKDEETLKYFETLQTISSRANRILNKLIEVHEMYQRSPTLEIINLERCVKAGIELAKKSELAKGIEVSYDLEKEGEWVSDKTLLVTAIENMLVNAFLFSVSKQSFVNLRISNGVDNQLKMTFEDNGYGILETDVSKVFNVFFKGSPRRSGTGLEIYAARIAIEKLNGTIDLRKPKDNTIYEIVLPELAV